MKKLLVLTTGGTLDKVYFDAKSVYQVGESTVPSVFESMNVGIEYSLKTICKKDSLELTEEDRQRILDTINDSDCHHVLITHGTDGMVETANFISPQTDKTIVLTGAMQPAVFRETDAIFNIGTALGILNTAAPGVYIAMNGRCFNPENTFKNYDTRRFETK